MTYTPNGITRDGKWGSATHYSTLSFTYVPDHNSDTVYFAYTYPYTYTDLQRYLDGATSHDATRHVVRRRVLCHTTGGFPCDLLTITSFASSHEALARRRVIVLSARVHPGEANSSWAMKGVLGTDAFRVITQYAFFKKTL